LLTCVQKLELKRLFVPLADTNNIMDFTYLFTRQKVV